METIFKYMRNIVVGSMELAKKNKGDYWDSEKVSSCSLANIAYDGKKLVSGI